MSIIIEEVSVRPKRVNRAWTDEEIGCVKWYLGNTTLPQKCIAQKIGRTHESVRKLVCSRALSREKKPIREELSASIIASRQRGDKVVVTCLELGISRHLYYKIIKTEDFIDRRDLRWTPEEVRLLVTLKKEGVSRKDIGRRLNKTIHGVDKKFLMLSRANNNNKG